MIRNLAEGTATSYKAFISYSHAADARLAPALQSAPRRIGKPWYRRAPFRIFLDNSSLAANPALWHAIETALGQSEYFLLLASTYSARSEWVEKELDWWLTHRTVDTILILVTEGEVAWRADAQDFDWERTTALNRRLLGQFHNEPLYVDLRWARSERNLSLRHPGFRGAILQIAPPLYGKSREDLDDEDVRQYRSARRTAAAAGLALLVLLLATAAAIRAARRQRSIADCRQLAAQAAGYQDTRLDLALLLGVESSRRSSCIEGRSALLAALQHRPRLAGFLSGHTDVVTDLAFAPDGRTVASSSWDRTVRLWDIHDRKPLGPVLKGMYDLSFSPDGTLLASADGQSVTLWKIPGGTAAGELAFDRRYLMNSVSFSPDGKILATSNDPTGTTPAQVFLWDAATRQQLGPAYAGRIFAFSPDGRVLATDAADGKGILLRDLRTRRPLGPVLPGHTANVRAIAFRADGRIVASGGEDHSVVVWDFVGRTPEGKVLRGHRAPVNAVAFSPDGTMLASGSGDGNVILWNVETWQPLGPPLTVSDKPVFSLAFAPDGRTLVSTSEDRVVVWDVLQDLPLGRALPVQIQDSSPLAFSPDGKTLAWTDAYGEATLSDATTGRALQESIGTRVTSVAFSPGGKLFASVGWDGGLALWDPATGEPSGAAEATHFRLFSVAFSPDGRTLAAGGDSVILVWDVSARRFVSKIAGKQKDRIWSVAFSPDGKLLASGGNSSFGLWDPRTGAPVIAPVTTDPHPEDVTHADVAFTPDGKLLAYRDGAGGVVLWDVAHRRQDGRTLTGHRGVVCSVAFSPNGGLLATGGSDGAVILWDRATRQPIGRPFVGAGPVWSLAFRPDGEALAVAGDKRLVVWDVGEKAWSEAACRIANRNLTSAEWKKFFGSAPYRETCAGNGSTAAR